MRKLSQKLALLFSWVPGEVVTERLCFAAAAWWVLQLAPSAHLFRVNSNFRVLQRLGGETLWQAVIGELLAVQIAGIGRSLRVVRIAALLLFGVLWMMIAALFYTGNPAPPPLLAQTGHWWTANTGVGLYAPLGVSCIVFGLHLTGCTFLDYLARRSLHGQE